MGGRAQASALSLIAALWSACIADPAAAPPPPDARPTADSRVGPVLRSAMSSGSRPAAVNALGPDVSLSPQVDGRVAAIQYGVGQFSLVDPGCAVEPLPDLCAVLAMIVAARQQGATLAVGPEYSQDQRAAEAVPGAGDNPGTSASGSDGSFIRAFSRQAATLQMYIVANIFTFDGPPTGLRYYNSVIAFGPTGAVLAVYHKINLWEGEARFLTPGTAVTVFPSPVGNVGMQVCSDLIGDSAMRWKLTHELGARVVALSTHWMTPDAISIQTSFAMTYKVYLLAANTTWPPGNGGGIYTPDGVALAQHLVAGEPRVLVADLPPLSMTRL